MDLFLRCRYVCMSSLAYHPSKMHLLSLTLYVYACICICTYAQYVRVLHSILCVYMYMCVYSTSCKCVYSWYLLRSLCEECLCALPPPHMLILSDRCLQCSMKNMAKPLVVICRDNDFEGGQSEEEMKMFIRARIRE